MRTVFDSAWHQRAIEGDVAAVDELAKAMLGPLYRFCFHRVGRNHHLCEEVVQETLVGAIRQLTHYDPGRARDNVFPWLLGLARNQIHRVLTREGTAVSLDRLWERMDRELFAVFERLEAEPFGDEVLCREETREMVNATMSQLPQHYREALERKYVEGKSVREMADNMRMSEKAVESQLTRARKAFRATFLALSRNLKLQPIV